MSVTLSYAWLSHRGPLPPIKKNAKGAKIKSKNYLPPSSQILRQQNSCALCNGSCVCVCGFSQSDHAGTDIEEFILLTSSVHQQGKKRHLNLWHRAYCRNQSRLLTSNIRKIFWVHSSWASLLLLYCFSTASRVSFECLLSQCLDSLYRATRKCLSKQVSAGVGERLGGNSRQIS